MNAYRRQKRNSVGRCYAVVMYSNPCHSRSGIYFSLEEAKKHYIPGICEMQAFKKMKDAKIFLRECGLSPIKDDGWVKKGGETIEYRRCVKNCYNPTTIDDESYSPDFENRYNQNRKRNRIQVQEVMKRRWSKKIAQNVPVKLKQDEEPEITTGLSLSKQAPLAFDAIQQGAIYEAIMGRNIFITGVAGTGKSLITKKIVEDAKKMGKNVAVAAPTGCV